jgi:hypothetical protein
MIAAKHELLAASRPNITGFRSFPEAIHVGCEESPDAIRRTWGWEKPANCEACD